MNIPLLITSLGLAILLFALILLAVWIEARDRKELFKRIRETKTVIDLPPIVVDFVSDEEYRP